MASTGDTLLKAGIAGVILFVGYQVGKANGWIKPVGSISAGIGPVSGSVSVGTPTPGGNSTTGPASVPSPNRCAFIPGVQYVEYRNGVYNVVIGGHVIYSSDNRADAEQHYNAALGC